MQYKAGDFIGHALALLPLPRHHLLFPFLQAKMPSRTGRSSSADVNFEFELPFRRQTEQGLSPELNTQQSHEQDEEEGRLDNSIDSNSDLGLFLEYCGLSVNGKRKLEELCNLAESVRPMTSYYSIYALNSALGRTNSRQSFARLSLVSTLQFSSASR